ncbi:DUF397 domain-containing protein [Streptomyces sp. NBC_00386]
MLVRDSKIPAGQNLHFGTPSWRRFIHGVSIGML